MKKIFKKYAKDILDYNEIHMLTGFKTKEEIQKNLFDESIEYFKDFNLENKKLLDIGTGAGIPGVPLKIKFPSLKLTLLEVMQKRIKFLKSIQSYIDFNLIEGRAEKCWINYKENFDIVTMRAVSHIRINLELAVQYLKINGLIILIKGPKAFNEILESKSTASKLNLELVDTIEKKINNKTNVIVVYKKAKECLDKYPREYNLIKNKQI